MSGDAPPSITTPDLVFAECVERSLVRFDPRRPPAPAVRWLGHGSYAAREATERLLRRLPDRLEIVRGLASPDAEVRHRCERLLDALDPCFYCQGGGCVLCDRVGSRRRGYFGGPP